MHSLQQITKPEKTAGKRIGTYSRFVAGQFQILRACIPIVPCCSQISSPRNRLGGLIDPVFPRIINQESTVRTNHVTNLHGLVQWIGSINRNFYLSQSLILVRLAFNLSSLEIIIALGNTVARPTKPKAHTPMIQLCAVRPNILLPNQVCCRASDNIIDAQGGS